jgi:hypothetical protein
MRDRPVTLYEAWNRPEEVEKWRAILLEERGAGQ